MMEMLSPPSKKKDVVAYHRCHDTEEEEDDPYLHDEDLENDSDDDSDNRYGNPDDDNEKDDSFVIKEPDQYYYPNHHRDGWCSATTRRVILLATLGVLFLALLVGSILTNHSSKHQHSSAWHKLHNPMARNPFRYMYPKKVVILEEYKLMFFTINKNGSTSWDILFRKMMGLPNVDRPGDAIHSYEQSGLKYAADYPPSQVYQFLNDPEWTKAVFLRDPLERWLSAYLDKVFVQSGSMASNVCPLVMNPTDARFNTKYHFETHEECKAYLEASPQQGFEIMKDTAGVTGSFSGHWLPQRTFVQAELEPYLNFVGYMETMEQDAKVLLQKIGAWEDFGATGYGPDGTDPIFHKRDTAYQHEADGSISGQQAATHASEKLAQYIDPALKVQLLDFYQVDYDTPFFNFTVPEF